MTGLWIGLHWVFSLMVWAGDTAGGTAGGMG